MTFRLKISLFILTCLVWVTVHAQSGQLHLFTDRDYCVSGDTLWFKVWMPGSADGGSNVARVQLASKNGNLIGVVARKSHRGWAEGFIHVPDSLSSGLYFVTAFTNGQRTPEGFEVTAKTLLVYNRFEENISEFDVVDQGQLVETVGDMPVVITTRQQKYNTRAKVEGSVDFNSPEIARAVVSARLVDPLARATGGKIVYRARGANPDIPVFDEKDGVLISGRVTGNENRPQKGVLVLLSITDDPPYFDYYITGEGGDFHFFLKNATGTARVVLQAVSKSGTPYVVHPELNYLSNTDEVPVETQLLNNEQSAYISEVLKAGFVHKLFHPARLSVDGYFDMPARFDIPFYGPPTRRVVPDEFYDLPDFREISRELLHGVQYRVRNNNVIFRMVNLGQNNLFDYEPLRLLNGIPVFKNNLLVSLKSTDIEYIDIIQHERVFGDLQFKGVLAVALYDKSNAWMAQQPNMYRFDIPCLQPGKEPGYQANIEREATTPDMRQVFMWKVLDDQNKNEFGFDLSDFTGQVEIVVEGVTTSGKLFKTSKMIEVK